MRTLFFSPLPFPPRYCARTEDVRVQEVRLQELKREEAAVRAQIADRVACRELQLHLSAATQLAEVHGRDFKSLQTVVEDLRTQLARSTDEARALQGQLDADAQVQRAQVHKRIGKTRYLYVFKCSHYLRHPFNPQSK